jgi:predicted lactoylglutathione lyase
MGLRVTTIMLGVRDLAAAAGGSTVRPAGTVQWGYFGYFADPDGHLWKVAAGS